MAVNITTGRPMARVLGHDIDTQTEELQSLFCDLLDQLQAAIYNLDAGNVQEAMTAKSVKAEHIDTKTAKIRDAQIKGLSADKIEAGEIDLSKGITLTSDSGVVKVTKDGIEIHIENGPTILLGYDPSGDFHGLTMWDKDGNRTVYQDSDGHLFLLGEIIGGAIRSNTSIDVTTDAYVGQNVVLRRQDDRWYSTGGVVFDSGTDVPSGRVGIVDHGGPCLQMSTPNYGNIEITTGVDDSTRAGIVYIRGGAGVRIGSGQGDETIMMNDKVIADRVWVTNKLEELEARVDEKIKDAVSEVKQWARDTFQTGTI